MMNDDERRNLEFECRNRASNDNKFTARMRFHQSWYRQHKLNLPPGPHYHPGVGGKLYGNILRQEDGDAGKNFLTPAIHQVVKERLEKGSSGLETQRLHRNMLSSQPMCFNLFAPLSTDLELATRLVQVLPGMSKEIRVTRIEFEYAPAKEKHLNDGTAFDVWIEYMYPDDRKGFVGIETKLTEPFSSKSYPFEPKYSRWKPNKNWWWKNGAEQQFPDEEYNQLWRNHLLVFAMLNQDDSDYAEGFCSIVFPEDDVSCSEAIDAYGQHLKQEASNSLLNWKLSDIMECWTALDLSPAEREWINDFKLRYIDLEVSQSAFDTQ